MFQTHHVLRSVIVLIAGTSLVVPAFAQPVNPNTLLGQPAGSPVTAATASTASGASASPTSGPWQTVDPAQEQAVQQAQAQGQTIQYVKGPNGTVMALPPLPNSQAFHQAVQAHMPLSGGDIRSLRQRIDRNRQAEQAPLAPVMPRLTAVTARLGAGSPPAIAMHSGYATTLNFTDAYGRPWPIVHVGIGDKAAFAAQFAGDSLMLSVLEPYAQSNLAVWLAGESQPALLALVPSGMVADYSVRVRVNAIEPGLPPPVGGSGVPNGNYTQVLLKLVQDLPPAGAQPLQVVGNPPRVTAWSWTGSHGHRLLLRTPMPVLAPAWVARMDGAAGIRTYVLPDVPTVTVSQNGHARTLTLNPLLEGSRHGG